MNQFACPLPPETITKAIERVLYSRKITARERNSFLAATFCGSNLNSYEQAKIKEIFHLLKRGRLQVII
ncbi:MAG: hypothetical protein ACFBSE_23390 [Prochloraceae cyanobacterium]